MKSRLKLLLIGLLFAAPIVAAWQLFFVHPEWQPEHRLNYGTLISPARALPPLELADPSRRFTGLMGKWTLVYLGSATCDPACEQRLLLSRQVRVALNRDRERVQRVYVAPDLASLTTARGQLAAAHPDLLFAADVGFAGHRAGDFFQPEPAAGAHALYLLDPLGNWLMVYSGPVEAKGIFQDLKKLLRFSQIG